MCVVTSIVSPDVTDARAASHSFRTRHRTPMSIGGDVGVDAQGQRGIGVVERLGDVPGVDARREQLGGSEVTEGAQMDGRHLEVDAELVDR